MSKRGWDGGSEPPSKRMLIATHEVHLDSDMYWRDVHSSDGFLESQDNSESKSYDKNQEDDEIDPLDAFMESVDEHLQQNIPTSTSQAASSHQRTKYDLEDEADDHLQSFALQRAKKVGIESANNAKEGETISELDYDSDDNPIVRKRVIEPLAPLNHDEIQYEPFEKNFYRESPEVASKTKAEVSAWRRQFNIRVHGEDVAKPVSTFSQFGFDHILAKNISSQGYEKPTPIQMQAVPAALVGRDIIGIASTGSGKTAAFVWPLIVHIMDQRKKYMLKYSTTNCFANETGPIGMIVAPTRELAQQIYIETKKFSKGYGIAVAPLLGGMGRGDTRKMLKSQFHDIVVATPGRLIDMLKSKLISSFRTTFLVLDEADKMFDMGFEPQVKSIVGQLRPDRQTLLFSATFKEKIENLARDILKNPVRITVGNIGAANEDITQVVEVLEDDVEKWNWLAPRLAEFVLDGSVLIFAGSKLAVEELCSKISTQLNIPCASIHGDKTPDERNSIMQAFKAEKFKVLVATDLAARGLDVKTVKTVINYQTAKDIDSHTHRIGRTGRAGDKHGIAFTLITPNESHFAGLLVKNLEGANQEVPPELFSIARRNPKSKHSKPPTNFEQRYTNNNVSSNINNYSNNYSTHQQNMNKNWNAIVPPSGEQAKPTPINPLTPTFVKSAEAYHTVELPKSNSASTSTKTTSTQQYDPFAAL